MVSQTEILGAIQSLLRIPGFRGYNQRMKPLTRITLNPKVMGGKPCIRGLRVTVGTVVGLLAAGQTFEEILKLYPYLEEEDLREALSYAAWRAEEVELPLATA
jgi:uncharacterized protein (DUF433 family)